MRIAISGFTGCGNSTVSGLVARKLKAKRLNYTFKDLAKELRVPFSALQNRLAPSNPEYDYALDRKQIDFALKNRSCVVGTRLAVWLDSARVCGKLGVGKKPQFGLKVWLSAPVAVRAERVAEREGVTAAAALKEVRARDKANSSRYKRIYGLNYLDSPTRADFVMDTSRLGAQGVADAIVARARLLNRR